MLLSKSFIPILKNNPSEAKIKSHQLMLRVGMIKTSICWYLLMASTWL
jgi:prolyl-tRNA synthetase